MRIKKFNEEFNFFKRNKPESTEIVEKPESTEIVEKPIIKPEEGYDLKRFYSAIEKYNDKNQKTRKNNLANTFFRNFIGKELLNSKITSFKIDIISDSDYYGINIELEDGSMVGYNFNIEGEIKDFITINPMINKDGLLYDKIRKNKKEAEKVSRKDARLIGKITKKINPITSYFPGTGDLVIKEYESKSNIINFKDFLNEKFDKEYIKEEALVTGNSSQTRSIDLRGPDGNAYSIMGLAQQLCKQLSQVDPERYNIIEIINKMKSSDYKNLVHTFEEYFGDYVTIYNADVLDE